jgi:hypothetical protein
VAAKKLEALTHYGGAGARLRKTSKRSSKKYIRAKTPAEEQQRASEKPVEPEAVMGASDSAEGERVTDGEAARRIAEEGVFTEMVRSAIFRESGMSEAELRREVRSMSDATSFLEETPDVLKLGVRSAPKGGGISRAELQGEVRKTEEVLRTSVVNGRLAATEDDAAGHDADEEQQHAEFFPWHSACATRALDAVDANVTADALSQMLCEKVFVARSESALPFFRLSLNLEVHGSDAPLLGETPVSDLLAQLPSPSSPRAQGRFGV